MLPQVSNTMGQAWLTLTQARAVLTQARNALVEATFVADVTWSRWARRGAWRRKWMWVVGLGSTGRSGVLRWGSGSHSRLGRPENQLRCSLFNS